MANPKVTKAVIAAAGFGTRFLPQTKAMPKEMLPLVDKPVIQYIVEQLVEAGIQDIIIVSGYSKRPIEDHFDVPSEELLQNLRAGGPKKAHFIKEMQDLADMANFVYVRQKGPYGNATPIMNAAHLIGNEPFIYAFADDVTMADPNMYQQLIAAYEVYGGSVVPCIRAKTDADYDRYGIMAGQTVNKRVIKASGIIEKPGRAKAPSDFAAIGGYLLTGDVFGYVEEALDTLPKDQEFYVTDSLLQPMIQDGKEIYGLEIDYDARYDTGNPSDYVKAVVDLALRRPDIAPELKEYLLTRLQS